MTEPAAPKDEHPGDPATTGHVRETRFAVVLNGGVSLAVWMGGVTHELNRLRLASDPGAGPDDPGEAAVHRAWSDILRETSGRTVIDTVAGTSAGGLNGSLLASAVAGGKDLPDMGTKWAEIASLDVGRLLRDPDRAGEDVADDCGSPQDGGPLRSLLDGRMFHREVNALFDDISASSPVTARQDCTLLVTATALESHPVPIRLEGDEQSAMVDSRRVYRFRRQTNGAAELRDDFTASRDCVARAARASASFPLAFEPVRETEELLRFRTRTADEPEGRWLIDGGVLDNAPFGPLMQALRERAVGEPFQRVVLYITPSFGITNPSEDLSRPPTAGRVVARVWSTVREPDQRLDSEELREAFDRMGYTLAAPHDAVVRLLRSPNPAAYLDHAMATLAAENWLQTYRFARAEAVERALASLGGDILLQPPQPPYLQPNGLPFVPGPKPPDEADWTWGLEGTDWRWGLATAERVLRWWGRALVAFSAQSQLSDGQAQPAFEAVRAAQHEVARLEHDLEQRLQEYVQEDPGSDAEQRAAELSAFYDPATRAGIRQAVQDAAAAIADLPGLAGVTAATLLEFTLAVEVTSAALAWGSGSQGDEPAFRYFQITPAARPIVDVFGAPGGPPRPDDPKWLQHKLYGQHLGNFGAFVHRDCRRADWLWGRLDGASALCDFLLAGRDSAPALRQALAQAILAAESTDREGLTDAAVTAYSRTAGDLLRMTDPTQRRSSTALLWHQAVALVEESLAANPARLEQFHQFRAFADPTWSAKDLPPGAPFRSRVRARLIHAYGGLARWRLRRGMDGFFGPAGDASP